METPERCQNFIPAEKKKESKSDQLRHATLQEYVEAHSKPNGNGWRGFLKSNLFVALCVWFLSQVLVIGGFVVSTYLKTSQLSEWKGQTEATIKRMDDQGTIHSHYEIEQLRGTVTELKIKVQRMEEDTRHIEVLESEHRRLTKDVEEIRNGKK